MTTIRVPSSDELSNQLAGLERLLTVKRWGRAAIVWAFTTPGDGQGQRTDLPLTENQQKFPCSIAEFARLGFAGLSNRETVARYRAAWQSAIDSGAACSVAPGDEVELPDLPWPGANADKGRTKAEAHDIHVQVREPVCGTTEDQPEGGGTATNDSPAPARAVNPQAAANYKLTETELKVQGLLDVLAYLLTQLPGDVEFRQTVSSALRRIEKYANQLREGL